MNEKKIKKSLVQIFWISDLNFIIFGLGYFFLVCFLLLKLYRSVTWYPYSMDTYTTWSNILCYVHFPLMLVSAMNYFTLENRTSYDDVLTRGAILTRDKIKFNVLLKLNGLICLIFLVVQMVYYTQVLISSKHFIITSICYSLYTWGGIGLFAIELGICIEIGRAHV